MAIELIKWHLEDGLPGETYDRSIVDDPDGIRIGIPSDNVETRALETEQGKVVIYNASVSTLFKEGGQPTTYKAITVLARLSVGQTCTFVGGKDVHTQKPVALTLKNVGQHTEPPRYVFHDPAIGDTVQSLN